MRWGLVAMAVACVALPSAAPAGDDADASIRRDFDALIRRIEDGPQPGAESPTAVVNRLLAAGDERLRPQLAEAWRIAGPKGEWGARRYFSVKWAIRFLYGNETTERWSDPNAPDPAGGDGIVRIGLREGRGSFCGTCNTQYGDPPTMDGLVAGGRLRKPLVAQLDSLLERLDSIPRGEYELHDPTLLDVARAFGEAASRDPAAVDRLVAAAASPEASVVALEALAWTKSPRAIEPLRGALAVGVRDGASSSRSGRWPLVVVCRGFVHVNRAAFLAAVDALPRDQQDVALWAAGPDVALAAYEKWYAAAKETSERADVLRRIAGVLARDGGCMFSMHFTPPSPRPETFGRLVRIARQSLDSSDASVRAAGVLLAAPLLGRNGDDVNSTVSSAKYDVETSGRRVEPYPTCESSLRTLCEDLDARRADLVDSWESAFIDDLETCGVDVDRVETAGPSRRDGPLGRELVWGRTRRRMFGSSSVRLRLGGIVTPDGLRLTLENVSDDAVTINPVALRHVKAELLRDEVTYASKTPETWRVLHLKYGATTPALGVRAESLVRLGKGESHCWTTALRLEDRDVDHIAVSLLEGVRVHGRPADAYVGHFATVWVK